MAELRRCRWCRLILDVHAPPHGEMVASNAAGKRERRVRPHCAESPVCDWCEGCYQRRMRLIAAGLDPNTGDPPAVTPDTMA